MVRRKFPIWIGTLTIFLITTVCLCSHGSGADPVVAVSHLRKLGAIIKPTQSGAEVTISESGVCSGSRWEHWEGTHGDLARLVDIGEIAELHIDLTTPKIGDLAVLPQLDSLEACTLRIRSGEVSPELMRNVARCPSLERLCISCARLRDSDLEPLKDSPKLRELTVFSLKNSDDSLRAIADIRTIEVLDFRVTSVTESGVQHLTRLPKLIEFRVTRGRIDPAARAWLTQHLPKRGIRYTQVVLIYPAAMFFQEIGSICAACCTSR